ncbi:MAG: amidohydrolase family protein, partial [Candidatus Nezhaarchaeales archaeon]
MMLSIDREEKVLILNVGMALVGRELEIQKKVSIEIEDGRITSIASGFRSKGLTFKHGVAMPALVNAHMHVLDYAFQEAGLNLELSELVSEPHGLKHRLISTLNEQDMRNAALRLFNKLIRQGVYKAVIFCERLEAISLLRDAAKALGLDVTLLARPKRLNGRLLIGEALDKADGLGLDSPLRYSISELEQMSSECTKRGLLKATHISETHIMHRQGDVKLAIEHFNSDMAIHGVHLEEDDVYALSLNNVSLVLCPRSNMWFSSGLPPLRYLLKHDVNLLI